MGNYLLLGIFFALAAYIYHRRRELLSALRRFDARNAARRNEELAARFDGLAHYRHTLRLAEEQVEEIMDIQIPDPHTGANVCRYLFQGNEYEDREQARIARQAAVADQARAFYRELDTLWLNRRPDQGSDARRPTLPPPGGGKPRG